MPVPPLHHRVLHAGIDGNAFEQPSGNNEVVKNVQNRNSHNRGNVKPKRDVHVPFASPHQRHEKVDSKETDPNKCDRNVDRPFKFGVFFTLCDTKRQSNGGRNNDQLPAPEVKLAKLVAPHASFAKSLRRVVNGGENRVSTKRKDGSVGMNRSQSSERNEFRECQFGHHQQQGHDQSRERRDQPPRQRCHGEHANDGIVVGKRIKL